MRWVWGVVFLVGCGAEASATDHLTGSDEPAPRTCPISASTYAKTCNVDSDCQPVYEGDVCNTACACPNAVINTASYSQYLSDVASLAPPPDASGVVVCYCPAEGIPRCCAGECVALFTSSCP